MRKSETECVQKCINVHIVKLLVQAIQCSVFKMAQELLVLTVLTYFHSYILFLKIVGRGPTDFILIKKLYVH